MTTLPPRKQLNGDTKERKILLYAWVASLMISGAFALALYLHPEWRQTTYAMFVEETDEEGKIQRKVKVERPEPNEEQVKEIARNQERKKREEIKREVKKLIEVVRETEAIKEERKKELTRSTVDDKAFILALEIEILAAQLKRAVLADKIMTQYEIPKQGSNRVMEIATHLADKAREDVDGVLTPTEAQAQVEITEELVAVSDKLVEVFKRGEKNLVEKAENRREKRQIRKELQSEIQLSEELLKKAKAYLAFIQELMEQRLAAPEESRLPALPYEQLAQMGRTMLNNLSTEQRNTLQQAHPERKLEDLPASELAELAADTLPQDEQGELASNALSEEENLPFDPASLTDNQNADLADQALEAFGQQAAFNEMLAEYNDEALDQMTAHDLYEATQELGDLVNENFTEARAAELAEAQSQSFEEALNDLYQPAMPESPDLSGIIGEEAPPPTNAEQFAAYNQALEQAERAASNLAQTAQNRASQLSGLSAEAQSMSGQQLAQMMRQRASLQNAMGSMAANQQRNAVTDMTAMMAQAYMLGSSGESNAFGDEGTMDAFLNQRFYEGSMGLNTAQNGKVLGNINTRQIVAQALPGRKFTDDSDRKGWLFIDTWYIIGPWERPRNASTSFEDKRFPPETLIDFDAEYPGKIHPRTKQPIPLKWRFVQTDRVRINPPDEITDSTYYAYTEVHSDRPRTVLLAVGSDDYAKVWINDLPVWTESGLSSWQLDQGFRKVLLKEGYNKILLRLESGPGVAYFSLMLCPVGLDI